MRTQKHTYISNIKLVPRVVPLREEVVGRRTRRGCSVEALSSHSHTDLTWDRRGAKARFLFTVLTKQCREYMIFSHETTTYLANKDRTAQERLLG